MGHIRKYDYIQAVAGCLYQAARKTSSKFISSSGYNQLSLGEPVLLDLLHVSKYNQTFSLGQFG